MTKSAANPDALADALRDAILCRLVQFYPSLDDLCAETGLPLVRVRETLTRLLHLDDVPPMPTQYMLAFIPAGDTFTPGSLSFGCLIGPDDPQHPERGDEMRIAVAVAMSDHDYAMFRSQHQR